jgi:hypothetical protein
MPLADKPPPNGAPAPHRPLPPAPEPVEGVRVFVLAAPGRDEAHARCFESIEASDIGQGYVVCQNPADVPRREHWRRTHELASEADTDLVLILEDDCLVNRHILANCQSWKWPRDPLYAAGWLYSPGGLFGGKDAWYTQDREWYGTVGVLYKRAVLPVLIERAMAWMAHCDSDSWDVAVSHAILAGGYRLRVHGPCLVEHQLHVPSVLQHSHNFWFGTTRGHFKPDWQRPLGCPHRVR